MCDAMEDHGIVRNARNEHKGRTRILIQWEVKKDAKPGQRMEDDPARRQRPIRSTKL